MVSSKIYCEQLGGTLIKFDQKSILNGILDDYYKFPLLFLAREVSEPYTCIELGLLYVKYCTISSNWKVIFYLIFYLNFLFENP